MSKGARILIIILAFMGLNFFQKQNDDLMHTCYEFFIILLVSNILNWGFLLYFILKDPKINLK